VIRAPDVPENESAAVRDALATLKAVINAPAADSTLILDRRGTILELNEIAAKRIGYAVEELTGRCLYELFEPSLSEKRRRHIEQVFETGQPVRFEDRRIGFEFDNHVAPVLDDSGQVSRVVVFARDITEKRRAVEEARLRQEQLIQADKMVALGRLVAGVAHEINNPNQFIMSNIALLTRAWQGAAPVLDTYYRENGDFSMGGIRYSVLKEKLPGLLQGIHAGSTRIKEIVRELRDYARREPLEMCDQVELNAVVESAAGLVANVIEEATEHFCIECDPGLPRIRGNFQRLEQVCVNLIVNACQALPTRVAFVRVSTAFDAQENVVVLLVEDGGEGIPAEQLTHISDPFFTTRRESGGTGLGLSVSAAIVEEHGGALRFESEIGKGTRASLRLPVGSAPDRHEPGGTP